MDTNMNLIPVFIGGTGRSGTTILRRVLACHPDIVSVPKELRIITDPDGALDLARALSEDWTPYRADKALHRFVKIMRDADSGNLPAMAISTGLRRVGIAPPPYTSLAMGDWFGRRYYRRRVSQLVESLADCRTRGSWIGSPHWQLRAEIYEASPFEPDDIRHTIANFFDDLFRQRASSQEKTHWVEDTPENLLRHRELARMFPKMRFIHIVRDPRDVVSSYRTVRWGGDDVEVIAKHRIGAIIEQWLHTRDTLPADSYLEVCLEVLSAHPREELTRICSYLGVPMHDSLLTIPLDGTHSGRWREDLGASEARRINDVLQHVLKEYGYS
jgi:Sulfotransferase family